MSWDIFVQDIPADARSVSDIPRDFRPQPIGSREDIVSGIRRVAPDIDFSDPDCGVIERATFSVEVNLGSEDPLHSFALHVRGGEEAANMVTAILRELGLRAFDSASEDGIFRAETAAAALQSWRAYRDQVVGQAPDG